MSTFSISNTQLSGSALVSALQPSDVRSVMFEGACGVVPPIVASASAPVAPTVDQWVQATVSNLLVQVNTLASGAIAVVSLGSGVGQAASYVNLFNLNSGDNRILRLGPLTGLSAFTGSSSFVQLGGADGTAVQVSTGVVSSTSTSGALLTARGAEAIVQVTCLNATPSSAVVNFNIL